MTGSSGFARLLATTGALSLALLPHVGHLQPWISAFFAGAVALRLLAERRGWAMPPRWLRLLAALAATLGVLAGYTTINGLEAGTALLVVMAALKLAETRAPRDHAVLVFIGYFLCLATLLRGQSFARLAFTILACWALTAALARVHRPVEANSPVRPFRLASRVLLLGLPLGAVLFVFVPRLEGRFWAIPQSEASARTGIDDTMSPGDVSKLSLSDEPAFRAWFDGPPPPPEQRYWRMLVLEQFDGVTWRGLRRPDRGATDLVLGGTPRDYRIALEPTGKPWLPALEYVARWPEAQAFRASAFQLVRADRFEPRAITQRFDYALRSYPEARSDAPGLDDRVAAWNLALPDGRHPRALALARQLRAASRDDADYVARVLRHFATGGYEYTLEPPPLGPDPVDGFLFGTRQGFCEHYASSFTVLMRAGGVPARIVTGYQGGEINAYGGYLLVRQSSAHAWAEVWLPERGWTRVDPTAAVAPERVRRGGLDATLVGGDVPGTLYGELPWLGQARAAWDAVRTAWNERVIGYDARGQAALLERLGLGAFGRRGFAIALAAGFALAALVLGAWLAWEFRPRRRDPVDASWERVCRRLAARGHPRAPHEGPQDYARRVAHADPPLAASLQPLVDAYVAVRYLPGAGPEERRRFVSLARAFAARSAAG